MFLFVLCLNVPENAIIMLRHPSKSKQWQGTNACYMYIRSSNRQFFKENPHGNGEHNEYIGWASLLAHLSLQAHMMSLLYTGDLLSLCPSTILMTFNSPKQLCRRSCHFVSRIYTRKRFYKAVTCCLGKK